MQLLCISSHAFESQMSCADTIIRFSVPSFGPRCSLYIITALLLVTMVYDLLASFTWLLIFIPPGFRTVYF